MSECIYSISNNIASFLKDAQENEWDDQTIIDTLIGLEGPLEEKVDNYIKYITNLESTEKGLKEEAKTLSERAKVFNNKQKQLKSVLLGALQTLDRQNIQAPHGTIARVKGRDTLKIDESELDSEFIIYESIATVDKARIKELVESGQTVKGAWIETNPESLTIRRK
ncbi:siphovirus Gp157 family protein [Photobacterium damselae subsp. damselae]|uniref:siphovirus Gp157 family protein n=1 Tax=Photobacterium damselae TaxID=38293 RepID=UPI001F2E377F|nr:siphovirus Gp157 family protein [Photobacterium damselae]UKA23356.1 siphovirus Gp157 family protein [Photobacterium damselae subsp. damselae]